jgi:hypothetical protein
MIFIAKYTQELGKIISLKEKVYIYSLQVKDMKGNYIKDKNMAKGSIFIAIKIII